MRNDRLVGRSSFWHKAFLASVPALALALTGCPADDPLPVGSVDGGAGSGGQGTGGSGSGGSSGTGGGSGTGGATQPGKTCGGIAAIRCAGADEYCEMTPGSCATPDAAGTCAPKPQGCTADYNPVCGCDDKTYSNSCAAASVSTSVKATGPCGGTSDAGTGKDASAGNDGSASDSHPSGKTCGGIAGLPCGAGEYCQFPVGDCKVADASGTCASMNIACAADVMQVCGCDGKTYFNECAATVAGANIASTGSCP
ncbi:MAG TPA: Kazal-type serine protease inhibitor domain-containing protein [Polyangia bacterium]|jgi:hypothetical protein